MEKLLTQEKTKKVSRRDLGRLFDRQIKTLKERGCPEQIIKMFQKQRDLVLKKASEMQFAEGNIPFIPVIPRTYRGICDLMTMVRYGKKQGYVTINPADIIDEIDTPKNPYYIYDVNYGIALDGASPKQSVNFLKGSSMLPLTVAEVIALCVHTDILSRFFVYAVGSRYKNSSLVPVIRYFDIDHYDRGDLMRGRPFLYICCVDYEGAHYVSPSCGGREEHQQALQHFFAQYLIRKR